MAANAEGGVAVCCFSGATLNGPFGIDLDANGNLFVASFNNNVIMVLNRSQSFSAFASGGGLTLAELPDRRRAARDPDLSAASLVLSG
jgi:hypothetical protein